MAAQNDKLILDKRLEEQRAQVASTMSEADYFEIFVAEQILKDYELSYDEIESGIVDGGGDGGVDGVYTFVNGELVREDSDFSTLRKEVLIELVIIQAKTPATFEETPIDRMTATTRDLFDTSSVLSRYRTTYNSGLLEAVRLFHATYQNLAGRLPRLRVSYHYASKGSVIHPNVARKGTLLKDEVRKLFSGVAVEFSFYTAGDLIELARRSPKSTRQLKLSENPISADTAFIGLAKLEEFYNFIMDDGKIAAHIFEANVRDYQGNTAVNEAIRDTLKSPKTEDFWWLNNGITIIASQATLSGKTLTIENPEIVNGLQTSKEVFDFFANGGTPDDRSLLVRVVVPAVPESRDSIIRATNSQTAIAPASLRATETIHHNIEDYLHSFGIFYDRRKNYYKNQGMPIKKIVSIPQLAQAVAAIVLQEPDNARARPTTLIRDDAGYARLFNTEYPIEVYRASIEIIKATDTYLASHKDNIASDVRNDLKYYVAMIATTILTASASPTPDQIANLAGTEINETALEQAYQATKTKYEALGGTDTAAKGPEMRAEIVSKIHQGTLF